MNNFDWLVQEFFTKSAAEDKKDDKKEEKKESKEHEAAEKKVEEQEKKEDAKEKKASRLDLYLAKRAGLSQHMAKAVKGAKKGEEGKVAGKAVGSFIKEKLDSGQFNQLNLLGLSDDVSTAAAPVAKKANAHEIAEFMVEHPGVVAGALAAAYGIGQGINIGMGALSHHIGKDMHKDSFPAKHPYMTELGAGVGDLVLPGTGLIGSVAARAGATRYAEELASHKPTSSEGVLARYSMRHPHLGPFLSAFVPGTHSVNSTLAAKTIADQAIKEKNFTYKHPYMSAYGHGLIPGAGTAYAQAAARIQEHKDNI